MSDTYYVAGRWSRREELAAYAHTMRVLGATITSRWLTDPDHRASDTAQTQAFNAALAAHDYDDLDAADTILYFSPGGSRGGCHVEFGLALAWGKRMVLIGPREHVFTWRPEVERFADFPAFITSDFGR